MILLLSDNMNNYEKKKIVFSYSYPRLRRIAQWCATGI